MTEVVEKTEHHDPEMLLLVEQRTSPEGERLALYTLYGILVVLIIAQIGLFCWKKRHKRSFELVTLLGLWMIPAFYSFELEFWRFLIIWSVYSLVTGYGLALCVSKNLSSLTPRMVYTWFFTVYRSSVVIGVTGYVTLVLELLGLARFFDAIGLATTPTVLLWYGLYFGILGRDCAEVASDWMQNGVMGGRRRLSVDINKCAICNKPLQDHSNGGESSQNSKSEKIVQLSCGHLFHEFCIRGWTMIGKKDICPVCGEKVDLKALYNRPWETTNLAWIKMLDAIRYLVVWNPVVFFLVHLFLHLSGIEDRLKDATVTHVEVVEVVV